MRSINMAVSATLVGASVAAGVGTPPIARAYDPAVNGTYTATVIGDWAQTNQVYHQEAVVRSTREITSSCSPRQACTGQVVRDQAWTAPLTMQDGLNWYVKHDIPNWQTCPDGSVFSGHDVIYFYPANPDTGENTLGSPVLAGRARTTGHAGV